MVQRLGQLFGEKLQKVPHFAIKHEKSSIWPKVSTFSSKLPWLGVLFNLSAKSCKKCLTSRERMKNRLFWEKLQLFRANYHGSAFGSTFRQKVVKSASFRDKERKIVDLAKTCNFFEQTTMVQHFGQLFGRKLQKLPPFGEKHEKSSIWPRLATFSSKLPCFRVWFNFSGKIGNNASFREKARKIVSLAKSCKFSEEPWGLGQLFNRKFEKVPHFAKQQINRRFGQNLQLSRANYHASAFGWTFRQRDAKSASFRQKARKIVDLAKSINFFQETTMVWRLRQLLGRKMQKVPHFPKKHQKSSFWPKVASF